MKTRVAMIGCGAVGSIHAANLINEPTVDLVAVYSPDAQAASYFAAEYRIPNIGESIKSTIAEADVAIVCSPSGLHFEQALECLHAGIHTLIELPPCSDLEEAEELGAMAQRQGLVLGCAHTARYLSPYARIQMAVDSGLIGEIREISYSRYLQPRARSWTDNALLHHAAHAIDLVIRWSGGLQPVACIALPDGASAQSTSILAKLPGGGPVTIAVSYAAKLPLSSMLVVGSKHTIMTDGFSYLMSDRKELQFSGEERTVYEEAIQSQDLEFLGACQGLNSFVPWAETVSVIRVVNECQTLSEL